MSLYVDILLQVLVPQDHAGLVPGARLEEVHELCGEGGPVLVPGAVDDVRHHVVPVLSGNLKLLIPVNMTMLLVGQMSYVIASVWVTLTMSAVLSSESVSLVSAPAWTRSSATFNY